MIKLYLISKTRPILETEAGVTITADMRITLPIQRGAKSGSFSILPSGPLLRKMRYAGLHPAIDEQVKIEVKSNNGSK